MNKNLIEFIKNNATAVLTVLTGYGYLCVYIYENAYLGYFHISSEFIEIQLSDVLKIVYFLMGIIPTSIIFFNSLSEKKYIPSDEKFLKSEIVRKALISLLIGFIIFYFFKSPLIFICVMAVVLSFNIYQTITSYRFYKKVQKDTASLLNDDPNITKERLIEILNERHISKSKESSKKPLAEYANLVFYPGIIAVVFFHFLGLSDAYNEKTFLQFAKQKNVFIIKKNGDNFICKNFNFKNHLFGDSTIIKKINDTSNNVLIQTTIK